MPRFFAHPKAAGRRFYAVDAMQVQIHDAQARRVRDDVSTFHEFVPEVFLLVLIQGIALVLDHVVVGGMGSGSRYTTNLSGN